MLRNTNIADLRRATSTWMVVLSLMASGVSAARADTVIDPRGVFAEITIVGMDDGKLVFKFKDGRTVSRSVTDLREIALTTGSDVAADEVTRAEALRREKQYQQAAELYERARGLSAKEWIRAYATFRLIETYADLGRFAESVDAYLQVTEKHPALVTNGVPQKRPEGEAATAILESLERREAEATSDARRRALATIRKALAGSAGGESGVDTKRSGPQGRSTGQTRDPGRGKSGIAKEPASKPANNSKGGPPRRAALPRSARATADVYRKLQAGRRVEAWEEIDKGLRAAMKDAPGSRDVWWLAEAEYELGGGKPLQAALAAMKVIAVMPESPYYAEALFVAARGYETERPSKARSLYEECQKHVTASEEIRKLAGERLAALEKAAASRMASENVRK